MLLIENPVRVIGTLNLKKIVFGCGKEIPDNSSFCGTSLQKSSKPKLQTFAPVYTSNSGNRKSHAKLIGGVVVAVVIIAAVLVIATNLAAFTSYVLGRSVINPPKPEVTMVSGEGGFEGLNYVFRVDVNVRNIGGAGTIEVFAQINGAGIYDEASQKIYLDEDSSQSLQFVFDVSVLGPLEDPSISYEAWAQPA
jgi:hypothetical protein